LHLRLILPVNTGVFSAAVSPESSILAYNQNINPMKTEQVREVIIQTLKETTTVTAHQINAASKGSITFLQIYTVMNALIKDGAVQMTESEGKKHYTLVDAEKLKDNAEPAPITKTEQPKEAPEKEEKEKKEEKADKTEKVTKPKKKAGRDMTTYQFNGNTYNKGRLAHAVIAQYAKEKKPSLKTALELFKDEIVPPYGLIKEIKEARKLSKPYQRFFIKPEEEIKLRDCSIGVSNQWTPDRIEALITIARKQLGYKIK
jgi:Fe2+ or Zn2+ uptake regulation protein